MLPLSHDEVVYGKGALAGKMPGSGLEKIANLRLLFGYEFMHPGKKLLFMGGEIAQWAEWDHEKSIEWHLLQYQSHYGVWKWVRDLNHLYRNEPALHELDFEHAGFEWVDVSDQQQSIISFFRRGSSAKEPVLVICNFTPVPRLHYQIGVPDGGWWRELMNSDATEYGGSGFGNFGGVDAVPIPMHGKAYSLWLTLPPLGILVFKK
jgi:1,4-alpha-glucan branching enzyme